MLDFHLPFHLLEARVSTDPRKPEEVSLFGLDAVRGTLDLYHFEEPPRTVESEAERFLPPRLRLEESAGPLEERVRQIVFARGFFALKRLRVRARPLGRTFYVPYWVGLYRRGERVRIEVLDAVRGALEGPRLREIVEEWLGG